jgi:signal transduction histidine kinase/CheY-like chemotaxis protein
MLDTEVDELERLRRTNGDLAACLALPALWAGREPSYVVTTLLDMLVSMLELDLAFAATHDTGGTPALEEWRPRATAPPVWIAQALERWPVGDDAAGGSAAQVPGVGNVRLARVPLRLQSGSGVVVAASLRSDFPSERDTVLLRATVNQAGIALHNVYLAREEQKLLASERAARAAAEAAEARLEFLGETARSITSALDLDTVLPRIVEGAKVLCGSDAAAIFLREGESEAMVPRYRVGPSVEAFNALRIRRGQGLGGQVLLTGKPARTAHYLTDDRISADFHEVARQTGTVALMVVPLFAANRVEGLLHVSNTTARAFTDDDEAVCLRLADQAAIAVRNARLYDDACKRQREAENLATVARSINTLDLAAVLQGIAESACTLLEAEVATLFRLDAESGDLILVAGAGPHASTLNRNVSVPRGTALVWLAVDRREAVVSADLLTDERFVYTPEMRGRIGTARHRAGLAVPLMVQGRITGALFVGALPGRSFSADEIRLVTAFADHAAVAMANAEFYHDMQRANRVKDEFIAVLGHELRNPLGAIAGAVGVLKLAGAQEPTPKRARAIIERQIQHLSRLVDDLLDVGRVTTGKVRLNRHPLDLGDLVASAMSAWRAAGRFSRHQVSAEVSSVWIDADETRIEQVLGNLVGNSLKYTPAGGTVTIRLAQNEKAAVLEVVDTGAGIPSNLRDKMFDLFVQGDRPLDRAQGGLGIGLTLVKVLVGLHGGTVEAKSAGPGKGSVFTIRLPCVPVPAASRAIAPPPPVTPVPRRILIIEDNADAREVLRLQLALEGHDVHEAADGQTGIDVMPSVAPDVVLVDVGLPGLDGYEVARRIRAGKVGKSVFLIALTGYGQTEDRLRALDAGFDAHLTKPASPEQLAAVITEAATLQREGS